MITITKKMPIPEDPSLVVATDAGDYADTDLILCADKSRPDTPVAQFQAQYIKYGPIVYQYNTPEALGAALYAIDPEATHDAVMLYKEDEARRVARAGGTLKPEDPVPAPDAITEEAPKEETVEQGEESIPETPSPEPEAEVIVPDPVPEIPSGGEDQTTSTTTPAVSVPEEVPYDPGIFGQALVAPPTGPEASSSVLETPAVTP